MTEYLRVTPTSEPLDSEGIPPLLESLHKLTSPASPGLLDRLNPLHGESPPRFEFLAVSDGAEEPVEFLYGADAHIETLEKRLRSIYPETFDIERVEVDVAKRLIPPRELSSEEFISRYENGQLQYEFGPEEQYEVIDAAEGDGEGDIPSDGSETDSGVTLESVPENHVVVDGTALEVAPASELDSNDSHYNIDRPTWTPDRTILARPSSDKVSPLGVRWCASQEVKRDWMTSLRPFTEVASDDDLPPVNDHSSPLTSLVEHLTEATAPAAFQVVFQRHSEWEADAAVRKEDLKEGLDTRLGRLANFFFGTAYEEDAADRQLSDVTEKRLEHLHAKNAKRSFSVNIRAVGIPTPETRDDLDDRMNSLIPVFDPLDGPFYQLDGKRLRDAAYREAAKTKNARATLRRLLNREVTTGGWRTTPEFVFCGHELANFVVVPSSEKLSITGERGTRAEQQSRNPLPLPNPDLLNQYQEGIAIGYPLDENGDPLPDPIRVPPKLLTKHYLRAWSTGGGKSKACINDLLSLGSSTSGPNVLIDRKGDGMSENYLRCHMKRFGDLEDVYYFRLPDIPPALSFFDIRPALEDGRRREDAIQDKIDHFREILRMVMGREEFENAYVANVILSFLIKALFDEEYGSDVFGLDDLLDAAERMQSEQTIPPVSPSNQDIETSLRRHYERDRSDFSESMGAITNRLQQIKEDAHLWRIFCHTPGQNDAGEYIDNRFNFREFLKEDATLIFDLGDLRPEAQRIVTLFLLSNLWDAVQVRRRDGKTDYENLTNLIIEESAPIASSRLVSEQLLPQGRSFGLSLGLVMQFPGQVRNRNRRAYHEILNNVRTKLIGNISMEHDLAESLAHEDLSPTELRNRINTLPRGEWIAQLPSPSFGETGPTPFSMKPLPIALGHPESDEPLTESEEYHFESQALPDVLERTQTEYGLEDQTESESLSEAAGWGSAPADTTPTADDSASDPGQSAFIEQATTNMEGASDTQENSDGQLEVNTERADPGSESEAQQLSPARTTDDSTSTPKPLDETDVAVPDDELRKRGLSRDDVRFLSRVLSIMNREDSEYDLLDSMRPLRNDFEDLNIPRLIEQDLVEEATACGRKYYTVLPAGRELLGENLQVGHGLGDIGEKTPHKVGVRLLELWLQEQDDVARVEPYYEYNNDTVFDVAGSDANGELMWVGEVELPSNNTDAPVDDYDKLRSVEANTIWAFNNRETAIEVLDKLADADRIKECVSGRDARSFSTIQDTVADFDAAGMTTIRGFKNLDRR